MGNKRFSKVFIPDTKIHLWIMTLLVMIIAYYNLVIGSIGVLLLIYFVYYNLKIQYNRKEIWTKYIEDLSYNMDSVTKHAVLNMPIPLVVIEFDGTVSWYNAKFSEMIHTKDILEKSIEDLIGSLHMNEIFEQKEDHIIEVDIQEKHYKVLYNIVKTSKVYDGRYMIMLYFIDHTNFENLKVKYNEEKPVVMLVQVDNYDDVLKDTEEEDRPLVVAEINKKISIWGSRMNAIVKQYQKDQYVMIVENQYLDILETKKFTILDEVREIQMGNKIPITLSIGVGVNGKTLSQLYEYAKAAMDLALGRGGDQAVVKKISTLNFYGGKTKAVEKRNKVKARVIAHALRQLIDQSKFVVIMGHKFPDMDSLGAALGVYRAATNREKEAYIILDGVNEAVKNLWDHIKEQGNYHFITSEEAMSKMSEEALLVVVDTHKPSFTQCPEILNKGQRIVLIDHHRRGSEFIDQAVLTYLEPYASSTCELVSEILQYMDEKINIEKIEAEALLAGISVDTKNFSFKTGVRTFEAASWLRRVGADTTNVRQLFQDDLKTFVAIADVVKNAKAIRKNIALSICSKEIENTSLVVAQAADELLNIRGITASFVLGVRENDEIIISGRSLGDISVQLILEKLGGGGHLTVAGTQLMGITVEEATAMLEKAIEEYLEEGEES
ncbi:DHH family phosphoesterase [Inediibacterium massiliense]|uniref:DHH family phosphoesterase n=1 Tax=Inediibacterium massiliense TaxID=1658111 RepID=UPI0006B4A2BD|nr:DHH family phosphoesterase [Inediibacterium massiliense]